MKLGPVLIGIEGTVLTDEARAQLQHPVVGGVVLFTRNFENRAQLTALVEAIRAEREPRLLLAVDQEGGRVQRFRDGFSRLPALGRIGEMHSAEPARAKEYAYWHGRLMAIEMLQLGIDLSFAPVLDLDRGSEVIGDRSFSARAEVVIDLGRAYLSGMHDAGMKTTGKHFPGHGSVQADSHIADVCDERSFAEIEGSDIRPFEALKDHLDALMIAHVIYPCVDDLPAGYSHAWLGECLRGRMAYPGVIFSDDLGMHAARTLGGLPERMRVSLESGCDSALVCMPDDVEALLSAPGITAGLQDATSRLQGLYGAPVPVVPGNGETLALWRGRLEQLC